MTKAHWSVAQAKASLSRLLADAAGQPQVIEKRGRPVAVVISMEEYRQALGDPADGSLRSGRWRAFLRASGALRAGGGTALAIPARRPRPSPFGRGE